MSIYENDDGSDESLPRCTECGAEEFLNPESGLCLDCQLALEDEEGDEEIEERECPECGEPLGPDGSCDNCLSEDELLQ